jgi:Leu/Phe-tRNA-protein transferase
MEKDFGLSEQESARLMVDRRTGTFSWTNPKYPIFFYSKFREILIKNESMLHARELTIMVIVKFRSLSIALILFP